MSEKRLSNNVAKKSNNTTILIVVVTIAIIAGLIFVYTTRNAIEISDNNFEYKQTINGDNMLFDPGFENIYSGHWDIAGYVTKNIIPIVSNNAIYGFKIENSTLKYHNEIKYDGNMSAYINAVDVYDFDVLHNWYQKINDTKLIPFGKNIKLSCWIKTKDASDVILMIQCWDNENLAIENMIKSQTSKSYYESINGTNNWQQYSIKLVDVPSNTKVITARLGIIGTGEVWFDDAELYTTN